MHHDLRSSIDQPCQICSDLPSICQMSDLFRSRIGRLMEDLFRSDTKSSRISKQLSAVGTLGIIGYVQYIDRTSVNLVSVSLETVKKTFYWLNDLALYPSIGLTTLLFTLSLAYTMKTDASLFVEL
ncbi:MAG: hypothetical protein EXX96DRAFT_619838 [Benjaminiella poitrasii]|nr:MAG: hypothetical protein EXX96DRAFT_619838 [Benjaminiella poitrasii]